MDEARFWNRLARRYAKDPIADMAGYERTLARTRALLNPTDAVLEFGCGTGTTAVQLAPQVVRYLATDVSDEMIAIGREKAAAANVTMDFAVTTPAALGEEIFDAVLGYNILHLIKDRQALYAHVKRLLRPGGLFISKTPCLGEMNPLIRVVVPLMQTVGRAPHVAFFNAAGLEREIEAAGFSIEERAYHGTKGKDTRPFLVARSR